MSQIQPDYKSTQISLESEQFSMHCVARAETPYIERRDAPCQANVQGGGARGIIHILPEFRDCIRDLQGFDRLWLLYVFNRNSGWKAQIKPPRDNKKRGLFSTRSPDRPSSIGLTAVKLEEVHSDRLIVSGLDLLNHTPILDIKPYIPRNDAFPEAKAGWIDVLDRNGPAKGSAVEKFHKDT